ncbi:YdcF family protein [Luteolibacter sp. SL250]|uniref:YdcF family protein n=1 Tax=Luteolibacter sp. SL250 TaxID=2995170 RepID=UPI002271D5B3|nr:ElyC/SanA/YdcF family protein [Luteolibacter sp. SL250]WAC20674.1 YdcF family protein [Luteolibacter sp. SL250]
MDERAAIEKPARPAGRFLRRRWVLLPTWRLSVIAAVVIGGPAVFAFLNLYGWLAVTEPVSGAETLIVEGWIPDHALEKAAEHARTTEAEIVFCTGIPLDRGTLDLPYKTFADYAAATLSKMGVPAGRIQSVPCGISRTERTRMMARALADHLRKNPTLSPGKRADLITSATHARRSRMIFREELGDDWKIGVISCPDPEADPGRWFLGSKSAKEVFNEMVAMSMALVGGN